METKKTNGFEELRKDLFSSFRNSSVRNTGMRKDRSGDLSFLESPKSSVYSDLSNFKIKTQNRPGVNTDTKYSPYKSPKSADKDIKVSRQIFRKPDRIYTQPRQELEGKSLMDLINISTLTRAIEVVNSGEIEDLPRAYIRQLKQFCNEALNNLNN